MWIFGPLPCSMISPVTVTFASAAASLVTVSPSTSRMAGRATLSPAAPARRLIVNVSPTATLCWLPPAFTTAYTTDSSIASLCPALCPARTTGAGAGCWTAADAEPGGTMRCPRGGGATRPAYLSRSGPVDTALVTPNAQAWVLDGRARRAAGCPPTARADHGRSLGRRRLGLDGGRRVRRLPVDRRHRLRQGGDDLDGVAHGRLRRRLGRRLGRHLRLDLGLRLGRAVQLLGVGLEVGLGAGQDGGVLRRPVLAGLTPVAPSPVAAAACAGALRGLAVTGDHLGGRRLLGRGGLDVLAAVLGIARAAGPVPTVAAAPVPAAGGTAAVATGAALLVDRIGRDDDAAAAAVLARLGEDLEQALTDPLAGHLHQAERGDLGNLVLGAVAAQALGEPAQHEVAVALEHHVDEVDDDDAADVAQPELADDLLRRLHVVARDRLLQVAAGAHELAGVDVDDGHRLGPVDDQRAARGEPHLAVERLGQLLVDPQVVEHVALAGEPGQAAGQLRGDVRDVGLDGVPGVVALDDELLEVLVEDVADDADRQIGLAVQQRW